VAQLSLCGFERVGQDAGCDGLAQVIVSSDADVEVVLGEVLGEEGEEDGCGGAAPGVGVGDFEHRDVEELEGGRLQIAALAAVLGKAMIQSPWFRLLIVEMKESKNRKYLRS